MRAARVGVAVASVLLLLVGCRAYTNRAQPNNPGWLLRRADEEAWRNDWVEATPLYRKAELLFEGRNQPAKALYARVSQVIATSELTSFSGQACPRHTELFGDQHCVRAADCPRDQAAADAVSFDQIHHGVKTRPRLKRCCHAVTREDFQVTCLPCPPRQRKFTEKTASQAVRGIPRGDHSTGRVGAAA